MSFEAPGGDHCLCRAHAPPAPPRGPIALRPLCSGLRTQRCLRPHRAAAIVGLARCRHQLCRHGSFACAIRRGCAAPPRALHLAPVRLLPTGSRLERARRRQSPGPPPRLDLPPAAGASRAASTAPTVGQDAPTRLPSACDVTRHWRGAFTAPRGRHIAHGGAHCVLRAASSPSRSAGTRQSPPTRVRHLLLSYRPRAPTPEAAGG